MPTTRARSKSPARHPVNRKPGKVGGDAVNNTENTVKVAETTTTQAGQKWREVTEKKKNPQQHAEANILWKTSNFVIGKVLASVGQMNSTLKLLVLLGILVVYDDVHNCASSWWYYGNYAEYAGLAMAILLCFTWEGMYDEFYDTKGQLAAGILMMNTVIKIIEPAMKWLGTLDEVKTKTSGWCSTDWCTNHVTNEAPADCSSPAAPTDHIICSVVIVYFAIRVIWKRGEQVVHYVSKEDAKQAGISPDLFDLIDVDGSGHLSKEEFNTFWTKQQQKLKKTS